MDVITVPIKFRDYWGKTNVNKLVLKLRAIKNNYQEPKEGSTADLTYCVCLRRLKDFVGHRGFPKG
jgi:hypothetical protein